MYTNITQLNNGYSNYNLMGGNYSFGSGFGASFDIGNMLMGNSFGCGSMDYDAMAGYSIANTLLNVGMGVLGNVMSSKQKSPTQSLDVKIEEFNKKIETQEGVVKNKQTALDTANKNLEDNNKKILSPSDYEANKDIIAEYKDADKDAKETLKPKFDAAVTANKASDAAEKAQAGLKEKVETAKKALEEAQETLEELKSEQAKLQEQNLDVVLDSADGAKRQQAKADDINALFDDKGNVKPNIAATKKHLRGAIAQYRKATDDNDRKAWADKILKLWDVLPESEKDDKLSAGIKEMQKSM